MSTEDNGGLPARGTANWLIAARDSSKPSGLKPEDSRQ